MGKFNRPTIMTGKILRLVNFLLDTAIYFVLLIVSLQIFKNIIDIENVKWISGVFYFLYYFIFEYFKGQTIGKMLTKSKVVSSSDNNNFFFLRVFIRTLTRLIPFDILSYIFTSRGLHDIFSKTTVINLNAEIKYSSNYEATE
jgi:uncharacterized RDD family membrane protein YckC